MSLYLKYRPQDFESVVGQEHVVKTLQNALKHSTLTHAYLFAGPRGTGKTSLARIIAKAINCTSAMASGSPCNQCELCQSINEGRLVDLIEIDAASNRGIDEIRDLREKILFAPNRAKVKVYIIDEVHMLTKEAFNALLKTLEEPPKHAYFILATTEAHKIPETIVSRCQQFTFRRITVEPMVNRLREITQKEGYEAEETALQLIARKANGGLRDAIGLLEQMVLDGKVTYAETVQNMGMSGHMLIEKLYQALLEQDVHRALQVVEKVSEEGQNFTQFASELLSYLREQMLLSVQTGDVNPSILDWIDIFTNAKAQMAQAIIPQLPLEMALLRLCGLKTAAPESKKQAKDTVDQTSEKEADQKAATPAAPQDENGEMLTIENIKSKWKEVLSAIETPFIRTSFLDGEPAKYEKGNLHMHFKSESMMEKVANPANQNVVLKAFEKIFDQKIQLKLNLKTVQLKSMDDSAPKKKEDGVAIDLAREVFGV